MLFPPLRSSEAAFSVPVHYPLPPKMINGVPTTLRSLRHTSCGDDDEEARVFIRGGGCSIVGVVLVPGEFMGNFLGQSAGNAGKDCRVRRSM